MSSLMFFGTELNPEQAAKISELRKSISGLDEILAAINKPNVQLDDVRVIMKSLQVIDKESGLPRKITREEAVEYAKNIAETRTFENLLSNEEKMSNFLKSYHSKNPVQFAQELGNAMGNVIAKALIEEAICRRIFPIDEITPPNKTKQYNLLSDSERSMWVGRYGSDPVRVVKPGYYFVHPELQHAGGQFDVGQIIDQDFDEIGIEMNRVAQEMVGKEDDGMFELFFKATSRNRASTEANAIYPQGTAIPPVAGLFEDNCLYLPDKEVPTVEDIMKISSKLQDRKYKAEYIIARPYMLAVLLSQSAFINASNYGNNEVQRTGVVQLIAGLKPVMSSRITDGRFYICDAKAAAAIAQKEGMYTEVLKQLRDIELHGYSGTANVVKNINAIWGCQTYSL